MPHIQKMYLLVLKFRWLMATAMPSKYPFAPTIFTCFVVPKIYVLQGNSVDTTAADSRVAHMAHGIFGVSKLCLK